MFKEDIEVKCNVRIEARERGKLVQVHEGHNLFLNVGRDWLRQLMSFREAPDAMPPEGTYCTPTQGETVPYYNDRHSLIRYMALGMGGSKQIYPASEFLVPPLSHYSPQSFLQTDTDPTVNALEIPVVIDPLAIVIPDPGGPPDIPPVGPKWLGQIANPVLGGSPGEVKYTRLFSETEISVGPFDTVPLSEIGLFIDADDANYILTKPTSATYYMIAYEQFNTIVKTAAIALQVDWTFRI